MKYSGFQTCVDLEYFTPILFSGSDTDFSDNDIHVDMMSPCSHASETSPGWRWHSISKHHVVSGVIQAVSFITTSFHPDCK